MTKSKESTYQINGRVFNSMSKRGLAGLRVEGWDKDLLVDDLVGSAVTDADGHFVIEINSAYYREIFLDREPDLFFRVFSGEQLIKSTEDSVMWNVAAGSVPVEISVAVASATGDGGNDQGSGEDQNYNVSGLVVSQDRPGVGGLRVEIVDKNIGRDVTLTQTSTDENGNYQASFSGSSFRKTGKVRPDLQARVFVDKNFLAASDVRYNATEQEILNVSLPLNSSALPSEHETLTQALATHFDGPLRDLKESDDRQDITYLANKTGWDARAVALAALADQFMQNSLDGNGAPKIKPAFYYALFRAGLPANVNTLYQTDAKVIERILKQSIEQGVVPKSLEPEITKAVDTFKQLGTKTALTAPAVVGVSSLKEMLTASRLDDAQQQQFAELYVAHRSDLPKFWEEVGKTFGVERANQIQLDGKLGFLTINNAALITKLHTAANTGGSSDPVVLAQEGYHRAARWNELLTGNVPVPKEIPGETEAIRRENYSQYLAAQVRLSYPTASIAQMVQSGELAVEKRDDVHAFLAKHDGKFEIGIQPVQQFIAKNKVDVAPEIVNEVKRVQRAYQITPTDEALTGLLRRGVDSAAQVARFEKDTFVENFARDLGGAEIAAQTYDKSIQLHGAVLNVAISYLAAKTGIGLGSTQLPSRGRETNGDGQILRPAPKGPTADNAADIIAYPTLEGLFGEMDFCACDHCRSILSPAAYLVDLLLFIDQAPTETGKENPQTVLLERRPDVQELPLTCENTNTALPYIDVVNETLEYFIANSVQKLSLNGYAGHDTDKAVSEDLLATPQSFGDGVRDAAYAILRDERFPSPLPFHQPLENLRRYFDKFEVPLPSAMERLRKTNDLERGTNPFGWRDVLMEELRLSRSEYEILVDSNAIPLWKMYGFPDGTSDADVVAGIANFPGLSQAKQFTRRVGITYDELALLLQTRFINPNSDLIPKLQRLGVSFAALKKLKDNNTPEANAEFDGLLPDGAAAPDPAEYDGDIKAWVRNQANYDRITSIITLTDPAGGDPCSFDNLEFRYSKPLANALDTSTRLGVVEFIRLMRFIRLWKKLGWTIEQTDATLCALFPVPQFPLGTETIDSLVELDAGFLALLPRLGIVRRVMKALNLTAKRDLLPLLVCWSSLGTHGSGALYRQMFLNPVLLAQDSAFADNGYGEFVTDGAQKILAHAEALRSAFNLTGDEFDQIITALSFDPNTALNMDNLSAVYRNGWLARKLKISVREFLLLKHLTSLDPFSLVDPTNPAIMRLIELVQALKDRSFKTAAALYLIWNQDLSGKSGPDFFQLASFARSLRLDFSATETEFAVRDDPDGSIAQTRMTLVYGAETADFFFGLINDTLAVEVGFTDPEGTLATDAVRLAIQTAAGSTASGVSRIAYDDFRKQLSYTGVLTPPTQGAIKFASGAGAVPFKTAVDNLFAKNQEVIVPFFARYPELRPLYDSYVASTDPVAQKRSALLEQVLPELVRRRKGQQALQALSSSAQTDFDFARTLLDTSSYGNVLHAAAHNNEPALNDFLALEEQGLSVQFFANVTATGAAIPSANIAENLAFAPAVAGSGNPLPANPTPGAAISGIWRGYLEAPDTGFFNLLIDADAGATVTLELDNEPTPLTQNGTVWHNTDARELRAGDLYAIKLTVENVRQIVRLQWEWAPKGQGQAIVPPRYLYPTTLFESFQSAYLHFLKAAALAATLRLTSNEMAHFASHADYRINALGQLDVNGDGWLNHLPNEDNLHLADPAAAALAETLNATLLTPLSHILKYAQIKMAMSPDDESLLKILEDPSAAAQPPDNQLVNVTHWDLKFLDDLFTLFGGNVAGLSHLDLFDRVYETFLLVQKTGISASALIKATTNEPTADTVRDLQAALRARYDSEDWRSVVQPINDSLRGLQRDALVAYILNKMRSNPVSAHIDTPDKLFEYFLMDVQMEPCMQTSRIRHALSSVQLFIERCLMNLEPRVSPANINARQWEWMKRYRVWEANRKIFFFPENWLEPELRDDKSPFFKEIESELLETDITEDSAASALLNYLTKLEEVAKLEPCGICHIEGDVRKRTSEIDHVIARTAGARRKYYYRRREDGSWTAWEEVKLEIDDNPVLPVVWNDRLLLFWLRILTQGQLDAEALPTTSASTGSISSLSLAAIKSDAKTGAAATTKAKFQAVLCWSEYYNGKWQPTKTSDINRPVWLGDFVPNDFDRSALQLKLFFQPDELSEALGIDIRGQGGGAFFLYNTHSLPLRQIDAFPLMHLDIPGPNRFLDTLDRSFTISYSDGLLHLNSEGHLVGQTVERTLLENEIRDHTLEPRQPLEKPWDAPFFYEDSRHVFFVTTSERKVFVRGQLDYGFSVDPGFRKDTFIPPLVFKDRERIAVIEVPGRPIGPDPRVIGGEDVRRFTEDAFIQRGLSTTDIVQFDGRQIGPSGALPTNSFRTRG